LTDLIVATEAELGAIPQDEIPINLFPGVDVKGIGLIELATLHSLVGNAEFDPVLDAFPTIAGQESEDGPWLNRLPDDFVLALAGLANDAVAKLAAEWSQTEEFQGRGWDPEDVEVRLGEIVELARRALQEAKPIHLWTCL